MSLVSACVDSPIQGISLKPGRGGDRIDENLVEDYYGGWRRTDGGGRMMADC